MRKQIKTQAIILEIRPFGEKDRIIELLTPEFGKISAVAKSARSLKSPFVSRLQTFNLCEVMLYESGSGRFTITDSLVVKNFSALKKNLKKIGHAFKIMEMLKQIKPEKNETIFELVLETLKALEKEKKSELVTETFRIKFLDENGFLPSLQDCEDCFTKIEFDKTQQWNPLETLCKKCKEKIKTVSHKKSHENTIFHDRYRKLIFFLKKESLENIQKIHMDENEKTVLEKIGEKFWEAAGNEKLKTVPAVLNFHDTPAQYH